MVHQVRVASESGRVRLLLPGELQATVDSGGLIGIQHITCSAAWMRPSDMRSHHQHHYQPQQSADYTFVLIAGRRVRRHRLNCIGVADSARKACYCIRRRAIQRPVPPCVQRGTAPLVNNDTDSSDGTAVWYNTTLYEHLRREDEWIIQNLCRLMQPPCGF